LDYLRVERGSSPLTLRNYLHYLTRFIEWLGEHKISQNLASISAENVRKYRLYLSKLALSQKTQGYHVIALRSFLKWLNKNGYKALPAENLELPKIKDRQVSFLNGEQVDRLLSAPSMSSIVGKRDKAILEVLFSTGLRVSELTKLNRDKIDLERREFGVVGKGGRARVVFLSSRAAEWVSLYLAARRDHYSPLFIRHKGKIDPTVEDEKMRLTPRSVQRLVKKYTRKVKLPVDATPHTIRHCIGPNTRIFLSNSIDIARDLYFRQNDIEARSLGLNNFLVSKSKVIGKEYHIGKAYSLWADGYELVCSKKHRVFTLALEDVDAVQVNDLKVGQYILGVNKVSFRGTAFVKPKLARLMGYILGDGVVSKSRRGVIIHDKDLSFLELYQRIVTDELKTLSKIEKAKGSNSWILTFYSDQFVNFLQSVGILGHANIRRIPEKLMNATEEEIIELLAGIYDAEGNSRGDPRYFSASKEFLKDIQILLLRFGIDAHLLERNRNVKLPQGLVFNHDMFTLQVLSTKDQKNFIKLIPTLKKDVQASEGYGEKLPVQPLLHSIFREMQNKEKGLVHALEVELNIKSLRNLAEIVPERKTVGKFITFFKNHGYKGKKLDFLKKIHKDKNIKWLKVRKITPVSTSGRYSLFDFTLSPHQNFITDGIISHNSYATDLLIAGADLRSVQEMLGHKNVATTQIYTHVTNKQLKAVHEQFHGRGK